MDWITNLYQGFPGLAVVIPITAAVLAMFRWAISRHDVHSSRRKDFLLHWKNPDELDDLSVEVLVRQLTGTYLPAAVVRRVCSHRNRETARTLVRLADMWSLVLWDPNRAEVTWKRGAASPLVRKLRGTLAWVAFFAAFIVGASMVVYVAVTRPSGSVAMVAVLWGVTLVTASVLALVRTDAWGAANTWGEALLEAANTGDPSGPPRAGGVSSDEGSEPAPVQRIP